MAFVNEYISESDKEKYGLDTLWKKYDDSFNNKFPTKWDWTIDRERETWLMKMAGIRDDSIFDHAYSSEQIWTLYYQGQSVEVKIKVSKDKEIDGVVYNRVWDLLTLLPNSLIKLTIDELVALLQEALHAYGYMGVSFPNPNYTVALRDCRKDK